jgi:hypothetical protein
MTDNTTSAPKFKPLAPDLLNSIDFACGLPTAKMHLCAIHPAGRLPKIVGQSFEKTASGKAAALKWITRASKGGYGIYFNINEVSPPLSTPAHVKASEAEISTVYALHVDVDPPDGTPVDRLATVRAEMLARITAAKPSLVVNSGNGYGVFFEIDPVTVTDANRDEIKRRNIALSDRLGGDDCENLDRVMRLPDTTNIPNAKKRKAGRVPVLASVVTDDRDFINRYKLDDFQQAAKSKDDPAGAEKPEGSTSDSAYETLGSPVVPDSVDISKLDDDKLRARIVDGAPAGADRSSVVYGVACDLRRDGWGDGDILAVLINVDNGISAHVYDQQQREPLETASRVIADMNIKGVVKEPDAETDFEGEASEPAGKSTPAIDRAKIIRTINKLLKNTTAKGRTADEAASFAVKARQLMDANGLTAEDLLPPKKPKPPTTAKLDDFIAYLPENRYIFRPTGALWPITTVASILGDDAPSILDRTRHCAVMAWAPGDPEWIKDRIILAKGGWKNRKGSNTFNTYIAPPTLKAGNAADAARWVDHMNLLFPKEAEHIIKVLAHKVRFPGIKINHGIIMGSDQQGIGKDTLLEPIVRILGEWNVRDVTAIQSMDAKFNPHLEGLMCRISEAHDLGEEDRFAFYNRRKTWMVTPPNTLSVADKHVKAHPVVNVVLPIISSNDKFTLYIDKYDRRDFVAWSECKQADFPPEFFPDFFAWYDAGGVEHVYAYLLDVDLSDFDPKAPPPKTDAWREIVNADQSTETTQLDDLIDYLDTPMSDERPIVFTLKQLVAAALSGQAQGRFDDALEMLQNNRQAKALSHKLSRAGYQSVQSDDEAAKDGRWRVHGQRVVIYGRTDLPMKDRLGAARKLVNEMFVSNAEQQRKERTARKAKRLGLKVVK